jgi:hypothetical protein
MAVRLRALLPRVIVVTAVWILASGTLTFAAEKHLYAHVTAKKPAAAPEPTLIVPDVRTQAFVFAKGILEDGGFAWRVVGPVHGYATNLVASQDPAPGTRLVDTGAPTIVLHLSHGNYLQAGDPEDASPYAGTAARLAGSAEAPTKRPAAGKIAPAAPTVKRVKVTPAKAKPAKRVVRRQRARAKPVKRAAARTQSGHRPPAFHVAGALREPRDEISLPARAERLSAWLTPSRRPTPANQRHWLYQHAWIVTGAEFGWWHGAAALRVLIRVDRRVESQWGIGSRSEAVARRALAAVEARAR